LTRKARAEPVLVRKRVFNEVIERSVPLLVRGAGSAVHGMAVAALLILRGAETAVSGAMTAVAYLSSGATNTLYEFYSGSYTPDKVLHGLIKPQRVEIRANPTPTHPAVEKTVAYPTRPSSDPATRETVAQSDKVWSTLLNTRARLFPQATADAGKQSPEVVEVPESEWEQKKKRLLWTRVTMPTNASVEASVSAKKSSHPDATPDVMIY